MRTDRRSMIQHLDHPPSFFFRTEIKLCDLDLEFSVKSATEKNSTYTGKQKNIIEFNEFVQTLIKMVSDKGKAWYDRAANTEGCHEKS